MEATPEFLEKAKSNYRSRKMKNCIEVIKANDTRQKMIINLDQVAIISKLPNGRAKFALTSGLEVVSLEDYEEISEIINAEVVGGNKNES